VVTFQNCENNALLTKLTMASVSPQQFALKDKVTRLEGEVQSVASQVDVDASQSTMNCKTVVIYWPNRL